MLKTQNYGFNKPELSDSPPDITVMNSNWDTIDKKIKENTDNINKNNIDMYHLSKFNRNLDDLDDLFLLSGDKYTIYNVRDKTPINSPIEGFVYGTIEYIPTTEGNGNRILIASGRGTLLGSGRKWFCTVRNDGVPYDKGWYEFATVDRSFVAKKDLFIALGTMDLNQAKTIGAYLCVETSAIYYENKPPFIGWFTMLIYEGGTGAIIQEAIQNSGGERCYREFNGAIWSDWKKIITSNNVSNPNLLINGDFQVWQRGEHFSVSSLVQSYTADRWCVMGPCTSTITKYAHGLKIENTSIGLYLNLLQPFEVEFVQRIINHKLTLTVEFENGIENVNAIGYMDWSGSHIFSNKIKNGNKMTLTFTPCILEKSYVFIQMIPDILNKSFVVKSVKLELGEVTTPLSPKNYSEELIMCQRYFNRVCGINPFAILGLGFIGFNKTQCVNHISLGLKMRRIPTIADFSKLLIGNGTQNYALTVTKLSIFAYSTNSIELLVEPIADNLGTSKQGDVMYLQVDGDGGGYIDLDSEIY